MLIISNGDPIVPIVQQLAKELAEAALKDEAPGGTGSDLSAGLFGEHVSNWLRKTARALIPTPEILPCPFCGNEAVGAYQHQEGGWYVACKRVHCAAQTVHSDTREEAIGSWNLRTLPQSIAALKESANFTPVTVTEAFLKQEIDNL